MYGDGGGLFGVGRHEFLYNRLLVCDDVSHITHVVIHFFEDFGGNAGGWNGWLGRHGGGFFTEKLVGASIGLDLPLKYLMRFKEFGFLQRPCYIHEAIISPFLHIGGKGLVLKYLFCGDGNEGNVGYGELHLL